MPAPGKRARQRASRATLGSTALPETTNRSNTPPPTPSIASSTIPSLPEPYADSTPSIFDIQTSLAAIFPIDIPLPISHLVQQLQSKHRDLQNHEARLRMFEEASYAMGRADGMSESRQLILDNPVSSSAPTFGPSPPLSESSDTIHRTVPTRESSSQTDASTPNPRVPCEANKSNINIPCPHYLAISRKAYEDGRNGGILGCLRVIEKLEKRAADAYEDGRVAGAQEGAAHRDAIREPTPISTTPPAMIEHPEHHPMSTSSPRSSVPPQESILLPPPTPVSALNDLDIPRDRFDWANDAHTDPEPTLESMGWIPVSAPPARDISGLRSSAPNPWTSIRQRNGRNARVSGLRHRPRPPHRRSPNNGHFPITVCSCTHICPSSRSQWVSPA
ncbi:hypothetical protein DFP72DRAFT_933810 [Ephemerocybe angulata]|uniref:Uncharacterized protein n=1 Tax=Ephemerocybe angulata TaxID=980116 RepID=A0A8H6LUN1_9AGAR|nr:hypothetical protein DFP72DRAFT_933810 [Tulosesus angulatus]